MTLSKLIILILIGACVFTWFAFKKLKANLKANIKQALSKTEEHHTSKNKLKSIAKGVKQTIKSEVCKNACSSLPNETPDVITVSNSATGTHSGRISKISGSNIDPHILVSLSEDLASLQPNNPSSRPLGVSPLGISQGEYGCVELFGSASSTFIVTTSSPIQEGSLVFTSHNGFIQSKPSSPGEYYCVGLALSSATHPGDLVEIDPYSPFPITI